MKEKSIVMKMLFEKLNAAFNNEYKITIDAKTDTINVTDKYTRSVDFYVAYDEDTEYFKYTANNIDSATLRALVNIENAIEEEYPYPEETVEYSVYCSMENDPDAYEPWCDPTTLDEAKSKMDVFKSSFPDRDFYILKTTTIEEKVIL